MGAQRFKIGCLDVLRAGSQQVGVPQDCLLLRPEQAGVAFPARLFQRVDLFVCQSVPLTRNGVRAGSKPAAVQDRRPEVGKVLELRRKRAVGPDRGMKLVEGPQGIRFMS